MMQGATDLRNAKYEIEEQVREHDNLVHICVEFALHSDVLLLFYKHRSIPLRKKRRSFLKDWLRSRMQRNGASSQARKGKIILLAGKTR